MLTPFEKRAPAGQPSAKRWSLGAGLARDSRDTLFLLAVIGWVIALQVEHVPWWCSALTVALLLGRAWITLTQRPLPGRLVRVSLLLATLGGTFLSHGTIVGRDAGVTLIVTLLALKTLELRARRDAFVVFFLAFFTLLTHFFYSQTLPTAMGILVALLGLLTALVNAHMPVGRPPLGRAARWAGGMALLGAPIMLVLFLLFPRMAPLWGIPSDSPTGRTGLSGSMQVGTIAELALDDSIAMRIRFAGPSPRQAELYFRGPVLTRFDGREWRPLYADYEAILSRDSARLAVEGPAVRYQVTQEPHSRPWLMVLDATAEAPRLPGGQQAYMSGDLQWRTRRPLTDLMRYDVVSHTAFRHGPLNRGPELQPALDLPAGFNPRTLALAQEMRQDTRDPEALVAAALQRLRTGGYGYTLEPGLYGTHTADEFWFDRKLGFCEHIASSFVILMRAMDIPARLVTGYQGGEVNNVDGYWTVRQRDAHAWTEVWIAGKGWLRVDPTSAVSPGRTGSFERLRVPQGAVAEALLTLNPTLAAQARAFWEAMNNSWNQWVLNYTQSRQLDLMRNLGFESPDWQTLAYALIAVAVLTSLAGLAWTLWDHRRQDPWLRLLRRARVRLRRAGLPVPAHATPRQLARQLPPGSGIADWLLRLEAQRYAAGPRPALATLEREFRQLPWPTRSAFSSPPA